MGWGKDAVDWLRPVAVVQSSKRTDHGVTADAGFRGLLYLNKNQILASTPLR